MYTDMPIKNKFNIPLNGQLCLQNTSKQQFKFKRINAHRYKSRQKQTCYRALFDAEQMKDDYTISRKDYAKIKNKMLVLSQKQIEKQNGNIVKKIKNKKEIKIDRQKIINEIIQDCEQNFAQASYNSKYLSKKIILNLSSLGQCDLKLTQDQRKSLQSNLIYGLMRYFQWYNLINFFKKYRSKVKNLKISTFQENVINGNMFLDCKNKNELLVSEEMIKQARRKMFDKPALYHQIFEKKSYVKLFEQNISIFKEKMILISCKLMQITLILQKIYFQKIYISEEQNKIQYFDQFSNLKNQLEQEQSLNQIEIQQKTIKADSTINNLQLPPPFKENMQNIQIQQHNLMPYQQDISMIDVGCQPSLYNSTSQREQQQNQVYFQQMVNNQDEENSQDSQSIQLFDIQTRYEKRY